MATGRVLQASSSGTDRTVAFGIKDCFSCCCPPSRDRHSPDYTKVQSGDELDKASSKSDKNTETGAPQSTADGPVKIDSKADTNSAKISLNNASSVRFKATDSNRVQYSSAEIQQPGGSPQGIESTSAPTIPNEDSASKYIADPTEERLFDISDLDLEKSIEEVLPDRTSVEVTFGRYEEPKQCLVVTVRRACHVMTQDNSASHQTQIRLQLSIQDKKVKLKTKKRPGENPDFHETFQLKIKPEELPLASVRFRLYRSDRLKRERMIGEHTVHVAQLNRDAEKTQWLSLDNNASGGDGLSITPSDYSTPSIQSGVSLPELLLDLSYNLATGRLTVEVVSGSNFHHKLTKKALTDVYVKMKLKSEDGKEISSAQTSQRSDQMDPIFKERFNFQIAFAQFDSVSFVALVYFKKAMNRKDLFGWLSLGKTHSSDMALEHWRDVKLSKGAEHISRWHLLQDPAKLPDNL